MTENAEFVAPSHLQPVAGAPPPPPPPAASPTLPTPVVPSAGQSPSVPVPARPLTLGVASPTPTLPSLVPQAPRPPAALQPSSAPAAGFGANARPASKKTRRPWPIRLLIWVALLLAVLFGAAFIKGVWNGYQESKATSAELSAAPSYARSYQFTFDFGESAAYTVAIDWPTRNNTFTTQEGEFRTIGDRRFGRRTNDSEWTEVAWIDGSLGNKMLSASVVFMEEMRPFLVSSTPGAHGGGSFVIDSARFSAASPDHWRVFNVLFSETDRPVPVPGDQVSIELTAHADGAVLSATVVFLPSGETTRYTLDNWSDEPLIVELPE